MFQVNIIRKMEWHIQLRHLFVDLPQQLEDLDGYLSTTNNNDKLDSANNDTRDLTNTAALANWSSYEVPTHRLKCTQNMEDSLILRFPNLRYAKQVIFSPNPGVKEGDVNHWAMGRWLVVAYIFAASHEAIQKLSRSSAMSKPYYLIVLTPCWRSVPPPGASKAGLLA